jgi:hypothetical protein
MAQNPVSRKNIEFGSQTFTQTPGFDHASAQVLLVITTQQWDDIDRKLIGPEVGLGKNA